MKKVILTGFEPFGDYEFNPTKESTEYFNSVGVVSGVKVIGLVLPCTYFGAFHLLSRTMEEENPDAVISVGLSSSVKAIRIETTFRNLMNGKYPDSKGNTPKNLPLCDGPNAKEFLSSTANNIYLANLLHSKDLPVEISGDADSFICNSLGYQTSKKILSNQFYSMRNMFIHIPWTDDYKDKIQLESTKIFLEKEKYYRAIELLIKYI
jgi:pyroglutamyl-peptidase